MPQAGKPAAFGAKAAPLFFCCRRSGTAQGARARAVDGTAADSRRILLFRLRSLVGSCSYLSFALFSYRSGAQRKATHYVAMDASPC